MEMIDLKKYFKNNARIGDIATTTSFGLLPRIIYKKTWGKRRKLLPYRKRAHLGTHVAIVIKYRGKWCFIEMDATSVQKRYYYTLTNEIFTPREYAQVKHAVERECIAFRIVSGCEITPWKEYATDNLRSPHICWIGRHPEVGTVAEDMNEWYINKYRYGVKYDFCDLPTFMEWNKRIGIVGSKNEYICSELPEAAFQVMNIRTRDYSKPWSPMDWQKDSKMVTIESMG